MHAYLLSGVVSLAFAAGLPQIGGPDIPPCVCSTQEEAQSALRRLAGLDWLRITRGTLATDLPYLRVLPPLAETAPGLEAIATEVARCCAACPVWGGASMEQGPGGLGLWQTAFWVCPRPDVPAREILHELRTAALPAATYTSSIARPPYGTLELYGWTAYGEQFSMRVDEIRTDRGVVGQIRVSRCRSAELVDRWALAGGRTLSVLRADVEQAGPGTRRLEFEYLTACLSADATCFPSELDALWPRLRALAAGESAAHIDIAATDCTGSSVGFGLELTADGTWKGGFPSWRPRDQGPGR